jgi:hypothetical protein
MTMTDNSLVQLWEHQQAINIRAANLLRANMEYTASLGELIIELTDAVMRAFPDTTERLTAMLAEHTTAMQAATLLLADDSDD